MRRIIVSAVLALVLVMVPVSGVLAASSDTVNVTATPIFLTISVAPVADEALGNLAENSTTWAYAAVPADPLGANCTFTTTNDSSVAVNISISAADFIGGNGWTLDSSVVTVDHVIMKAGTSGTAHAAMVVVTTSAGDNLTFHSSLAATGGTEKWEFSLQTGTFSDGAAKSTTITLQAASAV